MPKLDYIFLALASFKGRAIKINSHLISLGEKIEWEIALQPEAFLEKKGKKAFSSFYLSVKRTINVLGPQNLKTQKLIYRTRANKGRS